MKWIKQFVRRLFKPDIFQPYMPDVMLSVDLEEVFTKARNLLLSKGLFEDGRADKHCIAIITPDRSIILECFPLAADSIPDVIKAIKRMFPGESRLNISVIAYTSNEALTADILRCIPFIEYLIVLALIGHMVVVFEGHASAFEIGIRNSDVVILDSAMARFLPPGAGLRAWNIMQGNGKMFVYDRDTRLLMPVTAEEV